VIEAHHRVEALFLPCEPGVRFCLLHRPPVGRRSMGGIVYVHPFAEEMNKARRMAAIASRSLARLGYTVLQIDLHGCGDSSGEMLTTTVETWRTDIEGAATWMLEQGYAPLTVWGLRFGALLAVEWSRQTSTPHESLLLWQPVASGEVHLSQFLRIGMASEMLSSSDGKAGAGRMRHRLSAGEVVQVAGYDITPELACEMDALRMDKQSVARPVDWFEVVSDQAGDFPPAARRSVDIWRQSGVVVAAHLVRGVPFWATVEIADCPELIEATSRAKSEQWTSPTTKAR
jgi:exosortase A-associated hydrolase 2